ncbi:hypothetical protein [uncultured Nocardioides sp.]|uniref:hypothetical protein n=1 Tax=uncultured Nocardioides sp. TaxID=198441 RepID=UPI002612A01F|nr:hypothetical protein [uncultured Nocardioides sp.]
MTMPLFGGADEDRAVHATLAVIARLDPALVRDLLQEATGLEADLPGVSLDLDGPIPRLRAELDWWLEVSTRPGAYGVDGAARDRIRAVARDLGPRSWVFVISNDPPAPTWLAAPDGVAESVRSRIAWSSFAWLTKAIVAVLEDPLRPVDSTSRLLLQELVAVYEAEHLLDEGPPIVVEPPASEPTDRPAATPDPVGLELDLADLDALDLGLRRPSSRPPGTDVVVVPARSAWREYLDHTVLVCAPADVPDPEVTHVAFERDGRLMAVVPRIETRVPMLALTASYAAQLRADGDERVAAIVERLAADGNRDAGPYALLLLSHPGDPATLRMPGPVDHEGARFVRLHALHAAHP